MAEAVSGSADAFIDQMNRRAEELGMTDTRFANTHGLHREDHYTTAYDIYLMAKEAMKHETFRTIVQAKNYTVPATNMSEERVPRSTNALISTFRITGYYYRYATGIKTGSTPEAGYCLVSSATKDGRDLIAVVLGAENVTREDGTTDRRSFGESSRLLKWGFDNFSAKEVPEDVVIAAVPVTLSTESDSATVSPAGSVNIMLPNDFDLNALKIETELPENIEAPVSKGQKTGILTVSYEDVTYGAIDLVAGHSVERSTSLFVINRMRNFFQANWIKIIFIFLVAATGGVLQPAAQ